MWKVPPRKVPPRKVPPRKVPPREVATPAMTLTEALHTRGLRVTPQRLVIHEALERLDPQHAVCRKCGAVQELDAPVDASSALRVARSSGFQSEAADTVVSGLCARCAAQA